MTIKLGSTDISKVFLGTNPVNKVYLGSTLLFGATSPKAFKFVRVKFGSLISSSAINPAEIAIMAGATATQVGGTITADKQPTVYGLETVIDGSKNTGNYYVSGPVTMTVELATGRTDLTEIILYHFGEHKTHEVWLSTTGAEWHEATLTKRADAGFTQYFNIPE
jgi:hypothetical protein